MSLILATPTLFTRITSLSVCVLKPILVCEGFQLCFGSFSVRKCPTPRRIQSAGAAEDEPPVRPLWEDRLPDGESQLPGQGEWTNRGSSPGSLFAVYPNRGRAEAAGGELGGGAGGCEDQRGKEKTLAVVSLH